MARFSIRQQWQFESGAVLAPERYDPMRERAAAGVPISALATLVNEQLNPRRPSDLPPVLVLDTGDASEGVISASRSAVKVASVGSNKKLVRPGDVIISRLRPYLRQIAYVDPDLFRRPLSEGVVAVSTEFFVLRSPDSSSLGFLVPFLLSAHVQRLLAASQEGGHHPRVNQTVLEGLIVPEPFLGRREDISREVVDAVARARNATLALRSLIVGVEDAS